MQSSRDETSAVPMQEEEGRRARIMARAYELWEQRGCSYGHDLEDWLEAEKEILGPGTERVEPTEGGKDPGTPPATSMTEAPSNSRISGKSTSARMRTTKGAQA